MAVRSTSMGIDGSPSPTRKQACHAATHALAASASAPAASGRTCGGMVSSQPQNIGSRGGGCISTRRCNVTREFTSDAELVCGLPHGGLQRSRAVFGGHVRSCAIVCGRARSRAVENRSYSYFVTKLQWLHHKVCLTASHHPPRPPENNTYSIDRRNQSARRNLAQLTSE